MRSFLKAIGRMLRSMSRAARATIRKTLFIGGKLVSVLLPAGPPPIDDLEPDDAANDNVPAPISENAGIRDLAYCRLQGRMPAAQQLGAVTQLQADWLAAMDSEMSRRLLKATDAQINRHLRGNDTIKGVLPCDADTIEDYTTAMAINAARLERDLDLEQYDRPRMPGGMH
jgi:hypothetical protein